MSRIIETFGLKNAGGSASAFPISLNVDDQIRSSGVGIGIGRTTNPTAVADAAEVRAFFDVLGRPVVWPYQVRDLLATAAVDTATLAEVTLLAGAAGTFHDLVELTCANQSSAAVTLSLRDNLSGGIVKTLVLPATATQSFRFPAPVRQNEAANSWTIQNAGSGDISTTVVSVSAVFIKNV